MICCKFCYDLLDDISTETADVWLELCAYGSYRNCLARVRLQNVIQKELDALERLEFISVHETDKELFVRINGAVMDEDKDFYFCARRFQHDHDEYFEDEEFDESEEM